MQSDIYQRITSRIIADLEQGVRPWFKPWNVEHAAGRITRPLRANGVHYRGINVLMLWDAAVQAGFSAATWMTYKQARELGGRVRKAERSSLVVYASTLSRSDADPETGEEEERRIPYMRAYSVFNADQVDGLPESFYADAIAAENIPKRLDHAETFFAAARADIRHGGNSAHYNETDDLVQMPPFEMFRDAESYYSTLAHEMTHWTKHASRLDRDLGRKKWGDEGYAMEELVAELGAAFLCADLAMTPEPRAEHATYIASWLKVLKHDKRAIFSVASCAQRATDYLIALQSTDQ